ncbi:hypothetical protein LC065_18455 [Halobacillus litoralis]|uniref:hypothetical protein n=1 Tax=Halobacillus litoralis TaxID=45668 RepID=UPI001CFE10E3|nr:hypothetical protein [Halobacillus litoralis]WLR47469.1 hypothetical protein LC065_18455 [Halobacillus litoralis]
MAHTIYDPYVTEFPWYEKVSARFFDERAIQKIKEHHQCSEQEANSLYAAMHEDSEHSPDARPNEHTYSFRYYVVTTLKKQGIDFHV